MTPLQAIRDAENQARAHVEKARAAAGERVQREEEALHASRVKAAQAHAALLASNKQRALADAQAEVRKRVAKAEEEARTLRAELLSALPPVVEAMVALVVGAPQPGGEEG